METSVDFRDLWIQSARTWPLLRRFHNLFRYTVMSIDLRIVILMSFWPGFLYAEPDCNIETAAAVIVSYSGTASVLSENNESRPAKVGGLICHGERLATGKNGRSQLRITAKRTIVGANANTEIRFPATTQREDLDLLFGAMRFLSSVRGYFSVRTPYLSAGIEGTEAIIIAERATGDSLVLVSSGAVAVTTTRSTTNDPLILAKGEAGAAGSGFRLQRVNAETAPVAFKGLLASPRDASDWSIYYPPILFAATSTDPVIRRAAELLQSGRADEAENVLKVTLTDEDQTLALALRSLAAVFRNRRVDGLALAMLAVSQAPRLAPAQLALSYAHQAVGDLKAANQAAMAAVDANTSDAFAWARLAELALILSDVEMAREAANQSLKLEETSLSRSILGFVALDQGRSKPAKVEFSRAIELDSHSPLPRLGLGLALISEGATDSGRREIETAVALDPKRSNLRTWLARAYLAENDEPRAISQLMLAQERDPEDPTPNLVFAQQKFRANDPAGALSEIQSAERKGGARATVRGRAGLAEDQAVRSSALGRLYSSLGFEDLAIVKSAAAVDKDPTNSAARLALAEAYRSRDSAGNARVSEFLIHQLLAPPSLAPIQPDLGEDDLALLNPGGLSRIALYEFSRAFDQDGSRLDAAGYAGSQSTFGAQTSLKAKSGAWSLGLGQFYSNTDGFRRNNDSENEVYVLQAKYQTRGGAILTGEARRRLTTAGDRTLEFGLNPSDLRTSTETNELRLSYSRTPFSNLSILGFARYVDDSFFGQQNISPIIQAVRRDERSAGDFQARADLEQDGFSVSGGLTGYRIRKRTSGVDNITKSSNETYSNAYVNATLDLSNLSSLSLGFSVDYLDTPMDKELSLNPKFGATLNLFEGFALRGAYFRTVQRDQLLSERLEPSTIHGFNQLGEVTSDLFSGVRFETAAVGFDAAITKQIYVGGEMVDSHGTRQNGESIDTLSLSGYVNVILSDAWTASASVSYARRRSDASFVLDRTKNLVAPVKLSWFSPDGWFARGSMTYIHHSFSDENSTPRRGSDQALSVDATLGYRLPGGSGVIALEGRNLLDSDIRIQEPTDEEFRQRRGRSAAQFSRSPSLLFTVTATF